MGVMTQKARFAAALVLAFGLAHGDELPVTDTV